MSNLGEQSASRERLNLSELARLLIAAGSRNAADRSSVRLTRNARGDTQIEVVVGAGEDDADTIETVAERACATYDELRGRYPLGGGDEPEPAAGGPAGGV